MVTSRLSCNQEKSYSILNQRKTFWIKLIAALAYKLIDGLIEYRTSET